MADRFKAKAELVKAVPRSHRGSEVATTTRGGPPPQKPGWPGCLQREKGQSLNMTRFAGV